MRDREKDIEVWRSATGRVVVVRPAGELDIARATDLRRALREAGEGARLVLLDLKDVTFLDSTILGICVSFVKRCARSATPTTFMLTNPQGIPLRAISLTGMSYLLPADQREPSLLSLAR